MLFNNIIVSPLIGVIQGSKVSSSVPPEDLDISDRGYTSTQIDDYLIYHADILGTNNAEMDIRGNDNPTSASSAARQTLFNNYVLVNYNTGYTP